MDDEDLEIIETPKAWKHDKWSFIVLAVDLAATITEETGSALRTATTLLLQHRQHKIEENTFHEIVGE